MRAMDARYSAVAIVLHWLIALGIIFMLMMGKWMVGAIHDPATKAQAFATYQLHKSLGITILLLSLLRVVWRLTHRPPPEPAMPRWQKVSASAVHGLFYLLILAIPLSGWALVSASPLGLPTILYGLVEWPHIGFLTTVADRQGVTHQLEEAHELLGNLMILLVVIHVLAALKHQIVDRDGLIGRMLPLAILRARPRQTS